MIWESAFAAALGILVGYSRANGSWRVIGHSSVRPSLCERFDGAFRLTPVQRTAACVRCPNVIAVTVRDLGKKISEASLTNCMAISLDVDVTRSTDAAANAESIKMIVVLGLLVALGPLTIDMYLPALPKIAEDLSVSSSVAQLTLTGTLAGLAIGQLVIGPLSDSLGRRRPLFAGIVLHMVASLMCLFAPNIAVLGIARGLQGFGAAAAHGGGDRRRRRPVQGQRRGHGDVAADAGARRGAGAGAVAGRGGAVARRPGTGCSPRWWCWPARCC